MAFLINVYIPIMIFTNGVALILAVPTDAYADAGFAWLNPRFIYRHARVNWFGAIFLALIANAILPVIAIVYWFYKLCTIGRK
jgi:hypothetical protein